MGYVGQLLNSSSVCAQTLEGTKRLRQTPCDRRHHVVHGQVSIGQPTAQKPVTATLTQQIFEVPRPSRQHLFGEGLQLLLPLLFCLGEDHLSELLPQVLGAARNHVCECVVEFGPAHQTVLSGDVSDDGLALRQHHTVDFENGHLVEWQLSLPLQALEVLHRMGRLSESDVVILHLGLCEYQPNDLGTAPCMKVEESGSAVGGGLERHGALSLVSHGLLQRHDLGPFR
mmetsp:Transcript_9755/g.23821  ORF Transcript_9755/g.23821 Transcript_9755/m.23821 type:complete len:228 (+) Transcript_9755:344-1027(+)